MSKPNETEEEREQRRADREAARWWHDQMDRVYSGEQSLEEAQANAEEEGY